jgi:hypothetical protein
MQCPVARREHKEKRRANLSTSGGGGGGAAPLQCKSQSADGSSSRQCDNLCAYCSQMMLFILSFPRDATDIILVLFRDDDQRKVALFFTQPVRNCCWLLLDEDALDQCTFREESLQILLSKNFWI